MLQTKNDYLLKRLNTLIKTPYERTNLKKNLTEENANNIQNLYQIHKGERCFIIGGSPSLNTLDLTLLNNEYTFTTNRGYKLKEQGLTQSNYHIMSDIYTFTEDHAEKEIPSDWAEKFIIYAGIDFPYKNSIFFNYLISLNSSNLNFQINCVDNLSECGTVIYFALQFAYFMGFKNIYLIGVDLDFDKTKGHVYKETPGEQKRQQNHSIIYADKMLHGLEFATNFLQKNNIHIYNASPSGVVDCMPRVKYEELF